MQIHKANINDLKKLRLEHNNSGGLYHSMFSNEQITKTEKSAKNFRVKLHPIQQLKNTFFLNIWNIIQRISYDRT